MRIGVVNVHYVLCLLRHFWQRHSLSAHRHVVRGQGRWHSWVLRRAKLLLIVDLLSDLGLWRHRLLKELLLRSTSNSRRVITIWGTSTTPSKRIVVHLLLQVFEFFLSDFLFLGSLTLFFISYLLLPFIQKIVFCGCLRSLLFCESTVWPAIEWTRILLTIALGTFLRLIRWQCPLVLECKAIISLEHFLVMLDRRLRGLHLLNGLLLEPLGISVFIEGRKGLDGLRRWDRILLD